MKLSDKIRILRKARNMSQEELGFSLSKVNKDGISRQTVSDWENGKFEPKLDNIRDLAEVLNVSFDALLDESLDLNDDKVLSDVLSKSEKKEKDKIAHTFSYQIDAYERDVVAWVLTILFPIFAAMCVIGIIMFINALVTNNIIPRLIIGAIFATLGMPFTGVYLTGVKDYFHRIRYGKNDMPIGSLSNKYLRINRYQNVDNKTLIPVSMIESIKLGENVHKYHGEVIVNIKDNSKPLVLKDIQKPQKLVDIFSRLDSYIENPDDLKNL